MPKPYYDEAGITIYHGDCLEVMPELSEHSVDAVIADLPYGTTACKWDAVIPFEPLWTNYKRLIRKNGAIVLTASQPFTSALVMSNPKWFKYSWVWNKRFAGNRALAKYQPMKVHEDVLVFSNGTAPYHPQMILRDKPIRVGSNKCTSQSSPIRHAKAEYDHKVYTHKYPESIVLFSVRDRQPRLHPTQKPLALFEYLLRTHTNEGDLILDNTMGSGTTLVAAKRTGRRAIGIETNMEYIEKAIARLNAETLPLF